MDATAQSWDRLFEAWDHLACNLGELFGGLTERGKDYKSALDAIARGRAALAELLPAPRCERPHARFYRSARAHEFLGAHYARGGRWS